MNREIGTIRQTCMHLRKHKDHSDPNLLFGTAEKSWKFKWGKEKREKEVFVAIWIFINLCKLMVIDLLWRYGWSLYAYGVWAIVALLTILTRKNWVLFNSVQKWLVYCFWPFSYVYTINYALYIPLSRIKGAYVWKTWFIK